MFQDWQRTHTQSSVTVLRDLRQRMDVRFCEGRNQPPRGTVRAANSGRFAVRAPPKRASGELCFPLTKTYMPTGSYHCSDAAWPASTVEIQFRAPLQAHWRRRPGRIAGFPATPFAIKRQNRALFGFVRIKRVQVGHLQDLMDILRHTCTISNSPRTLCVLVGQRPTGEILPLRRPEGVTRRNQDLALGRVVLWIQKITRNPLVSLYVQ